jgi:urease subunit beta
MIPGETRPAAGSLQLSPGRERRSVRVRNIGDRPIQVGSHFHFADVNDALRFERELTVGFHLDLPAGTSMRFEPGVERDVPLVALGGARLVPGLRLRA